MPDFDPDAHLHLVRYLSGGCSEAEAAKLELWLAADPARQQELDALRRLWELSAGLPPSDRVDEMWRNVARQIGGSTSSQPEPRMAGTPPSVLTLHRGASRRRAAWRRWGTGFAAAAGVAMAAGYGVWMHRLQEQRPPAAADAGQVKEYRTAPGQRGAIQLGDGTRVELSVASVLRVHPFTDGRRDVELEGEAVFEVIHDPARPFAVRSRNVLIEDLGTRFGVRAYDNDQHVRVVVAEGKVALRADAARPDTAAVLAPGDLGTVDDGGRTQVRRGIEPGPYFSWVSDRLLFDNMMLAEVAADLERWYDVDITLATPDLAAHRVTVSIPVGSLADALDAVTAPLGLTYTRHGTAVSLHGK